MFHPTQTGVAPHGALGAKQDTTEQNFEARSEQEVMRVKPFRSAWSKASIEVTYNVPVSEEMSRGNKLQRDGTSKRTSGFSVFPRCQMLILAFCLLFQEGYAGRILMYLPVATRYVFGTCSFVHTWNFYTSKILNGLEVTRQKCVNHDIFGSNFRMEDVLLIYFEQIVIFPTQIQTNSSSFVESYNISSLN